MMRLSNIYASLSFSESLLLNRSLPCYSWSRSLQRIVSPTRTSLLRRLFIIYFYKLKRLNLHRIFRMFLNAKMLLPPCVPEQEVQGCMLLVNNAERIMDEIHLDLQLLPNLQSLFPAGHTSLEDGLKDLGHLSCCGRLLDPPLSFLFVSIWGYQRNRCLVVIFNGNIQ
jgi:hypothetical protein